MQTQVHVGVVRPSESSKLWGAISKRSDCGCGEVPIVSEPLDAVRSRDRRFHNCRERIAIRPRTTRERSGLITGVVNGQGETRAEGDDGPDFPASDDRVHYLVVAPKSLPFAKGYLI